MFELHGRFCAQNYCKHFPRPIKTQCICCAVNFIGRVHIGVWAQMIVYPLSWNQAYFAKHLQKLQHQYHHTFIIYWSNTEVGRTSMCQYSYWWLLANSSTGFYHWFSTIQRQKSKLKPEASKPHFRQSVHYNLWDILLTGKQTNKLPGAQ